MKVSRGTFVSVADLRALFLGASFRFIERLEQSLDGAIDFLTSALSGFVHRSLRHFFARTNPHNPERRSDSAREARRERQKHNQQYPSGHVVLSSAEYA